MSLIRRCSRDRYSGIQPNPGAQKAAPAPDYALLPAAPTIPVAKLPLGSFHMPICTAAAKTGKSTQFTQRPHFKALPPEARKALWLHGRSGGAPLGHSYGGWVDHCAAAGANCSAPRRVGVARPLSVSALSLSSIGGPRALPLSGSHLIYMSLGYAVYSPSGTQPTELSMATPPGFGSHATCSQRSCEQRLFTAHL